MKNNDDIKELLEYFQNTEGKSFKFDEEAIHSACQEDSNNQSLPIKVLSVFGGILASLAFLGFLSITGLFKSDIALLMLGMLFTGLAILINRESDKVIIDTLSISFYVIGFVLFGIGSVQLNVNENLVSLIFISVALISLSVAQSYILSFVSVLIINASVLFLLIFNKEYDFVGLYVAVLALAMTYFFLKEAKIITNNRSVSKLYNPVRIALVFSFLSGLVFLGKKGILTLSPYSVWVSSLMIIFTILYLVFLLFENLSITSIQHKITVSLLVLLALMPTVFSPAISGAILIMLLSFFVNYKTGLALGIISFIYFISQYYYDLEFTLLTKSILLFSTGVFFLLIYLFSYKKMRSNEKV